MGRGDLTDDEWARLAPHLPKPGHRGGRWSDHQTVINGILFRIRTGAPWRDLPERFGSWKTIYERHRRWSADGTWDRMLQAVLADADAEGRIDWSRASVDSTSCRAHQHAAGAPRKAPRIPKRRSIPLQHRPDEGLGRSRGGLTCKIHLAGEGDCRPLALLITSGHWGDSPQMIPVLGASGSSALVAVVRAPAPTTWAATRRTAPAATAATCAHARSSTPSPSRKTSVPTAGAAAPRAVGQSAPTRSSASATTRWSAPLTGSSTQDRWRHVMTKEPTSSPAP